MDIKLLRRRIRTQHQAADIDFLAMCSGGRGEPLNVPIESCFRLRSIIGNIYNATSICINGFNPFHITRAQFMLPGPGAAWFTHWPVCDNDKRVGSEALEPAIGPVFNVLAIECCNALARVGLEE